MLKKRFTSLLKSKSESREVHKAAAARIDRLRETETETPLTDRLDTEDNRNSIDASSTTTTFPTTTIPPTTSTAVTGSSSNNFAHAAADSPEATCARAVVAFCESGNASAGGDEVLHLPVIVEAAESSPAAAAAATHAIRNFLGKEYSKKPHVQYNAIMLVRILCDNPGQSFTRNFDKPFVSTVKELLRNTKDGGTQQIMRETLDALEVNKRHDTNLQALLTMWAKEKGNGASLSRGPMAPAPLPGFPDPRQQQQRSRSSNRQLPNTVELASRVEEAKNTAKILLQLVQSTATADLLNNELIKEFSERCQSAQRSMQVYIGCQDPAPDHDTMQTLIETNEQLSLAMSRYQRAVLAARRELGVSPSPPAQESTGHSAFAPPPAQQNMSMSQPGLAAPPVNGWQSPEGTTQYLKSEEPAQNPFADPSEQQHTSAFSQPPQSFNIDSGAVNARTDHQRDQLENTYSAGEDARTPVSQPSPVFSHPTTATNAPTTATIARRPVSPQSPPRPGLGPYHQSEITQSYVGRQSSAVNGLTMHGAAPVEEGQSMASRGRGY